MLFCCLAKETMKLQSRKETCMCDRLTFLWLWSAGLSMRAIAHHTGRSPHTVRRWLRWWYEAPLDQCIGYHYSLPDAATSTSTELPISVTHSDLSSFTSLSPRWTGVRGSTSPPSLHDAGLVQSRLLHRSTCGRHDTGGVTLFLVLRLLPPTSSHDSAAPPCPSPTPSSWCSTSWLGAAAWRVLPYRDTDVPPLRVTSWRVGHGLALQRQLFPEKFWKLSKETTMLVAMEQNHRNKVIMQPDPAAPGGTRILFRGFMVSVLEYLAQGLNFS
ncbi:hypothetical protein O3P69_001818 [Scylla paramamosain]|uniref:Transposase n=1 Tax=Scylla paramamosain TaxID=85552 RepID=A0AAW0V267_SCYPA